MNLPKWGRKATPKWGRKATRRGLFTGALGVIPAVRDAVPEPPAGAARRARSAGNGYRSYREGVASARRRERDSRTRSTRIPAAGQPPASPRTWRQGAAEVAVRGPSSPARGSG